jgi:hypothetical protein
MAAPVTYTVNRCRFVEYMPCGIHSIVASPNSSDIPKNIGARAPILLAVSRATSNNIELWNMGHDGQDIFLERVNYELLFCLLIMILYD